MCTMRIASPKYATAALRSFSSKVRQRTSDVEQSTNYQQLEDGDCTSPRCLPDKKFLRKRPNDFRRNTTISSAGTTTEHTDVRNSHYTSTDDESRGDDHMRLLGNYDKQIEDRCQILEMLSSEDGKPFNHSTTKKRLLLLGSVELGGSSPRQGPMTLHELGFKPLQKTVHFSTVEVKTYQWDRINNKHVYYTKDELSNMGNQRNKDASKLRKERLFSGHHEKELTPTLLSFIFDPNEDIYKRASSRGIEHYVYPELRREIVRKQKIARAEVLNYVRSNPFDPDGMKLREHSEQYTRWARELALKKAKWYAQNNALFLIKYMQACVVGKSAGKSAVQDDATLLEFNETKTSIGDVEPSPGKASTHKHNEFREDIVSRLKPLTEANLIASHQSDFDNTLVVL